MSASESTRHLQGTLALLKTGIAEGSRRIEDLHLAIADKPFRVLGHVPVVAGFSGLVRHVHDGITRGVHAAIRAAADVGCDAAIRVIAHGTERGPR